MTEQKTGAFYKLEWFKRNQVLYYGNYGLFTKNYSFLLLIEFQNVNIAFYSAKAESFEEINFVNGTF